MAKGKRRGKEAYKDIYDELINLGDDEVLQTIIDPSEDFREKLDGKLSNEKFWKLLKYVLSERNYKVLICRFQDELTLEKTGKLFHITTERVRQIEAKALRKCRHPKLRDEILDLFPLSRIQYVKKYEKEQKEWEAEGLEIRKREAEKHKEFLAEKLENENYQRRLARKYKKEEEKRKAEKERREKCIKFVSDNYDEFLKRLDDPKERALLEEDGGYDFIIEHIDRENGLGYEKEYVPSLERF